MQCNVLQDYTAYRCVPILRILDLGLKKFASFVFQAAYFQGVPYTDGIAPSLLSGLVLTMASARRGQRLDRIHTLGVHTPSFVSSDEN